MMVWKNLADRIVAAGNDEQARNLSRFFKTGPGEYGEGDCFLGVKVPVTRDIVAEYRGRVSIDDVRSLTESRYHEVRLAGFLCLIEIYKSYKRRKADCREIVDIYLSLLDRGNNWDLVDVIAPKILGDYLVTHVEERGLLYELASMEGRAKGFFGHRHDLMHKTAGWMLREWGSGAARIVCGHFSTDMPRRCHALCFAML